MSTEIKRDKCPEGGRLWTKLRQEEVQLKAMARRKPTQENKDNVVRSRESYFLRKSEWNTHKEACNVCYNSK